MHFRLIALLSGLAISGLANSAPKEIEVVLEQMIAAYGGETNLRKLDSTIQEWDLLALTRNQQGIDKRSIQLPNRLKVELIYADKRETRLLSGDEGLVVFGDRAPAPANAMQRDAMRLQLMRLYSPLTLREEAGDLRLSVDDDTVILTLAENSLRVDYYIDSESWRTRKIVGTLTIGDAKMDFVTEYSDFAVVEGVLVHHRENKYAGNVNTAVLRLRQIVFNAEFGDEDFQAPSKPDAPIATTAYSAPAYERE